jgi:hypothetical protein
MTLQDASSGFFFYWILKRKYINSIGCWAKETSIQELRDSPRSVYRKNLISYLMRKNEEIRGKRLGSL